MTDTVPLDVILTNTNYPKQSFAFYVQIKHRSTVHTILIVTPVPATHQKIQLGIDTPCIQSCSQKFFVVTFVCVDFAVVFFFS